MAGGRLAQDQIGLVLRRASELDRVQDESDRLDAAAVEAAAVEAAAVEAAAVEAAAVEAGLSRPAVCQALAELRV
ncbi:MAG: hypothetical protein M3P97_10370, partial [Actinomycetota bacterium]|nr:hypothetical protein [Actinomycetota bacterium]